MCTHPAAGASLFAGRAAVAYPCSVDAHRVAEERSLAYHRAVAERLRGRPELIERARARVESWLAQGPVHPVHARRWARLLTLPLEQLADALVDPSEDARELRQVSPFAGALSARERWAIWREVGRRLGAG
jgi:hypothetical protein